MKPCVEANSEGGGIQWCILVAQLVKTRTLKIIMILPAPCFCCLSCTLQHNHPKNVTIMIYCEIVSLLLHLYLWTLTSWNFVPLIYYEADWLQLKKCNFFSALWWNGSFVKLSFSQGDCWEMQCENCGGGLIGHKGRLTDGSLRLVMKPRWGCTTSNSVESPHLQKMSGVNTLWMKWLVSLSIARG